MGFKNTIRSFKNVAKAGLAAAGGYAGGYGYSKRKSGGSSWIKKKFKKRRYGKKFTDLGFEFKGTINEIVGSIELLKDANCDLKMIT